jgi:hypothetical protein
VNTPSTSVSPGLGGFLAFFLLAIALWLLMRNMNKRMRRMTYREEQEAAARAKGGQAPTTPADGRAPGGSAASTEAEGPADAGDDRSGTIDPGPEGTTRPDA